MPSKKQSQDELKWPIPEHPQYERGFMWYAAAAVLGVVFLIYCIINNNFLFAIIIVLGVLLSLASSWKKPELIEFRLARDGVSVGEIFYPLQAFQGYWTAQEDGANNLGLDLKNWLKTDLYVPVKNFPMAEVEKFVAKFLKKNNERKEEPLSYFLARKLKI